VRARDAEIPAVILINLLPHREERRKRRKAAYFAGLGVAAAFGLAIAGVWYLVLQQMTSSQQQRNQYLATEIAKLEVQIKDIAQLRAEIESLKARQKAVEDLQIDRNVPVHVLNELVKQTPEGIYYTMVKQDGQTLTVAGIAQTNERVSEFLRNTANNSEWLVKPELVEIKSSAVAGREQKRLYDFSVRVSVKRPAQEKAPGVAPAASAASTPSATVAKKA
jgi:type IV pilus assembly protein PilN